MTQENETLYVGVDESNNHGDSNRAFIVATTFSRKREDSFYVNYSGRRDFSKLDKWLKEGRDFRFSLLTSNSLKGMQPLATLVAPYLVSDYIFSLTIQPKNIKICFDGRLPRTHKEYIREYFTNHFENVVVENITKKRRAMARRSKQNRLQFPPVLIFADTLANKIYNNISRHYLEHKKRVSLNDSKIGELYFKLKN